MADNGIPIISHVYDEAEVTAIIDLIDKADTSKTTFRKTDDLFACYNDYATVIIACL